MKTIFMGTPDFAVPSLYALDKSGHEISLVVTRPDRTGGRGKKLVRPPVKTAAAGLGYDVIQPESIKTDEFKEHMARLNPDLFVVVAFGHILPKNILSLPKKGSVNIHASLLPKYRGPAPIQWAIINGEKETGVTAMLMDQGLDTGDILFFDKVKIAPDDTSATLHDRLAVLGADLLIKTVNALDKTDKIDKTGKTYLKPVPQDDSLACFAPLLKKSDGRINWDMPAEAIEAFIRGMTPWPGAFTFYGNRRLKIFKAAPLLSDVDKAPGTVVKGFPGELRVASGKGVLSILEIQGASGKRLLIKDFLMGCEIPPGTLF